MTRLLRRSRDGDSSAIQALVPILYRELRQLARNRLRAERDGHTLTPTALVHEFYLRLVENRRLGSECRLDFFALASRTMRRVLVDHARSRKRLKRGGDSEPVPIEAVEPCLSEQESDELIHLEEALQRLSRLDERTGQVVELRFFGGLTLEEIAEVLQVSTKTVQRDWIAGRAWLKKEIGVSARA